MTNISPKKLLIAFIILIVLSRTGKIINAISYGTKTYPAKIGKACSDFGESCSEKFSDSSSDFERGKYLTLEPLARCSPVMRCLVTVSLMALAFVVFWKLIYRN